MKSSFRTFRVVHLPTSVGGNPAGLSSSLKEIGLESETWVFEQNTFNYSSSKMIWAKGDSRLIRELKRWSAIIQVALNFDVIHFNFGSSCANPIPMFNRKDKGLWIKFKRLRMAIYLELAFFVEMWIYRLMQRPLFVHYQGDDARQGDFSRANFEHSIAHYVEEDYYTSEADALKRRMIRRMSHYCTQVYAVNPDLIHVLGPGARFIPYSHISLSEWRPIYTQLDQRPLRIAHAPSHRRVKGTELILEALEQLSNEGCEFDLELIEGLPHNEARLKYEHVDVLLDQLHAGWYGGLAVEAMALGKPVMAYIRNQDLQFIPSKMRDELPIIPVSVETLKTDLRQLIHMPRHELHDLAQRSRAYVERWHDPIQIAKEIKQDYEKALFLKRGL